MTVSAPHYVGLISGGQHEPTVFAAAVSVGQWEQQMQITETTWVDHKWIRWKTPTIIGRLKMRIPCHRALREYIAYRDGVCQWCGVARRNGGRRFK